MSLINFFLIFQSIITRGTPKELCVWIADRGSVLTWDFNVVKGDCEFIVYYTEKVSQFLTFSFFDIFFYFRK